MEMRTGLIGRVAESHGEIPGEHSQEEHRIIHKVERLREGEYGAGDRREDRYARYEGEREWAEVKVGVAPTRTEVVGATSSRSRRTGRHQRADAEVMSSPDVEVQE